MENISESIKLYEAAKIGDIDLVESIIKNEEVNWDAGLEGADVGGHFYIIEFLLKKWNEKEALVTEKQINNRFNIIKKGQPLSPDEIPKPKTKTVSPELYDIINQLICETWDGESAKISQNDICFRSSEFFEPTDIDYAIRSYAEHGWYTSDLYQGIYHMHSKKRKNDH